MTAKYAVTDEQRLAFQAKTSELTSRFLKNVLDPVPTLNGLQVLIENRSTVQEAVQIPCVHVTHHSDPLDEFRGIDGLFICGQTELDQLFRTEDNPLKLKQGWIPELQVEEKLSEWIHSAVWRDTLEWNTRAILTLVPPRVGKYPTHLIGQHQLLGVDHDGVPGGVIRKDIFYSNFFVQPNYDWARKPATRGWWVALLYEHPHWTTDKDWASQQTAAQQKRIKTVSAALDVWGLNMVLACHGIRLRENTYSRTDTIYDGNPLDVYGCADGVYVRRNWSPLTAHPLIALSVHGVPLGL